MKQNLRIVAVEPIGITGDKAEELKQRFEKYSCSFTLFNDRKEDEASLVERIGDNEVVIISNIPLRRSVLERCPNIRFLAVAFTGLDHIDLDYCQERGIEVVNAAGYATEAVSELTIGLMLDVLRKISPLDKQIRQGGTRNNYLGYELKGKKVGIVGLGAIGKRTALILKAFGADILAYSRKKDNLDMLRENVQYVSLEELMSQSDIISLHTPLTKETYHLIDDRMLSLCKPSAILINTSRGNVVDMQALALALNEGRLSGAAVDVYENEPPISPDHPLLNAKNCICVPHIAYATRESFDARIEIVANNIEKYLEK